MQYTLPRNIFDELVKNVGKDNAEKFANAIEKFLEIIKKESEKEIIQQKESLKAELYNELRNELATKEFVRAEINEIKAEINEVRAEIKNNNLLLKVLIGISLFALTVFNPNFVSLIEKIIK
jgi:predicted solute-binding protein